MLVWLKQHRTHLACIYSTRQVVVTQVRSMETVSVCTPWLPNLGTAQQAGCHTLHWSAYVAPVFGLWCDRAIYIYVRRRSNVQITLYRST
jgi:hypothetical protein